MSQWNYKAAKVRTVEDVRGENLLSEVDGRREKRRDLENILTVEGDGESLINPLAGVDEE